MKLSMNGLEDLPHVASEILKAAAEIKAVVFRGEIGAGKTTLIKQICQQLGVQEVVVSPTFGLVNSYHSPLGSIHHFDWYRIRHQEEAIEIGWEEYVDSGEWLLVEWPEKIEKLLPEKLIDVYIETLAEGSRTLTIRKF